MNQPSSASAPATTSKTSKMAKQMVIGAIVGAVVTIGLLTTIGKPGFDLDDPSRVVALITGLLFALTGLIVGLGVLAPKPGAQFLNVEDADELREQRGQLSRAAVVMLLLGIAVLALALAAVDRSPGLFPSDVAGLIVAISLVGVAILSFAARKDQDELMLSVGREALALAMYVVTVTIGIWAALAHLGYIQWITPLGMIGALLLSQLVAIGVVSAQRGLLRPR